MRYEDTTQAGGIAQGQGPNAENDLDALTAGSRTPAMGNVITGDGTKSGAAGADTADHAHIISIAGKGGEDSSFVGGKLTAEGDYGKLTIDADGNYRYVPKANVPENSLDRFVYTLADGGGAHDAAVLTIEFGKTQTAVKANAQQVVPGPDGVVVLPAGVELSDVHIVGRNLVIDLPDGTQMVIVDGAVFVPQLSLDGVDVPATNLAALLIGSEPKPAAGGEPPSSGGNFEVPVPPLDPGVPLGDLIPPTEYNYTPPEVHEEYGILDHHPTVTIDPGDGIPVQNAIDSVDESGLPVRPGEPAGSNSAANSETTTGTIIIDSQDNPTSVAIDGVVITSVGQVIHGQYGDLTITSIASGAIGYSYTLLDNTGGNNTSDIFNVVVTDVDGDTANASLTVNIVDDVPTARNDSDTVAAGTYDPETGNVVTGTGTAAGTGGAGADTVGADNAFLTSVSGAGGSDSSFDEDGYLVVHGQYGTLSIDADGNYSYIRDPGTPGGVSDVFNYTLTDGDGDPSTASLTINIADSPTTLDVPTGEEAGTLVYESGLPTRNGGEPAGSGEAADGNGANNSDPSETTDGVISFTAPDGPATVTINGTTVTGTVGQVIHGTYGDLTITSYNGTTGQIGYSYTLLDNTSGDATKDSFAVVVKDVDGDTSSATLNINIVDDAPTAHDDVDTVAGGGSSTSGNVISGDSTVGGLHGPGADVVGADNATLIAVSSDNVPGNSDTTPSGADGQLVVHGEYGVLTIYADGHYDYVRNDGTPGDVTDVFSYTLKDGDGDPTTATLTINIEDSAPSLGTPALVQLDDDAVLGAGGNPGGPNDDPDSVNASGTLAGSGGDGALTYSFSGTDTLPSGFTLSAQPNGDLWVMQGATHVMTVTLDTATGAYAVTQVHAIDHPTLNDVAGDNTENNLTFDIGVKVTDVDGDPATATLTINVDDDTPTVTPRIDSEAALSVDESGPTAAAAIDTGSVVKGDDPNVSGSGAISHDSSGVALVNLNASFGADGPAASNPIHYELNVTNATSGLTLTDGSAINLVELANGNVVGVVQGSGAFAGQAAFAIAIDPTTGVVTIEQYLSLDHPLNPNPNDSLSLAEGSLAIVGTATDHDGDTVSTGNVDVSGQFTFLDDGPSVNPRLNAEATVSVDESLPSTNPTIVMVDHVAGNDPDLAGGLALGHATSGSAIVSPGAAFGADGPAAGGGVGYALTILNTTSGLTLTDGTPINLVMDHGVIVGVVASGAFAGQAALAIAIDPTTGVVTVEQYLSLHNPDAPTNYDEIVQLANNTVGVTVTATDGDGDSITSGAVDVSHQFSFHDDGPQANNDTANQSPENAPVTVNVFANDVGGADGALASSVAVVAGSLHVTAGQTAGVLTNNGDGSFTYTPSAGQTGTVTFDYTITDGDGDKSQATVTINLTPDSVPIPTNQHAYSDDDGLPNANTAFGGGDIDANQGETPTTNSSEAVYNGQLVVNFGADTPGAIGFANLNGTTGAVGTETVSYSWNAGTNTLTATTVGGTRPGTVLFDIHMTNTATGTYVLTQHVNILQAPPVSGNGDETSAPDVVLHYQAVDSDNSTSTAGTLTITFNDDVPHAVNDTANQSAENAPVLVNVFANDAGGADGALASSVAVVAGSLHVTAGQTAGVLTNNGDGSFTYTPSAGQTGTVTFDYTITDGDGDKSQATVTINLTSDSIPQIGTPANLTLDEDGFANANVDNSPLQSNPQEVDSNESLTNSGSVVVSYGSDVPTGTLTNSIALVDTAALDGQLQRLNGSPVTFALNGSGQLVGSADGHTVVIISITGAVAGPGADQVTYTYQAQLLEPLEHPPGGGENTDILSGVTFQVTDSDGSHANGAFNVTVYDDVPSLAFTTTPEGTVVLTTRDAYTDGTPTDQDAASTTANFSGVFALNATPGADGGTPSVISYDLNVTDGASGLSSHGAAITLVELANGTVVGYTGGIVPTLESAASVVFSVKVDASGDVTLTQYQQIDHPAEASPVPGTDAPFDDQLAVLANGHITLTGSASLTDGDGDTANASRTIDLGGNLQFADDGPALSNVSGGASVTLDETSGAIAGLPGGMSTISATSASAVITATQAFGADGPAASGSVSYGLSLSGGGATVASGLQTAVGDFAITLNLVDATHITGTYNGANVAFAITMNANGTITVTQNVPLEHLVDGSTAAAYDDSLDLVADGSLTNLVNAIITIKDYDGDTATASTGIGDQIIFKDDGPSINVTAGADAGVTLTTQDHDTIGVLTDTAASSVAFGGVFNFTASGGADGASATPVLAYALGVSSSGVDSGLDSHGANIYLYTISGVVVGSTSSTLLGVTTGNTIFDVSVSGAGVVTLSQYAQIDHPAGSDPTPGGAPYADHSVSMADGLITLTGSATIVDNDGDSASSSQTVNIGANLIFQDDGPSASLNGAAALDTLVLDESRPIGSDTTGGSTPSGLATVTANFADNFTAVTSASYGADGAGSTAYSLVLTGTNVASGLYALQPGDTSTIDGDGYGQGAEIVLNQVGNTITGSVGITNYFTITVDPSTGVVTFTQLANIWHATTSNDDDTSTMNAALNAVVIRQTVTDFDGDTATANLDLSKGVFQIQDDGPEAYTPNAVHATNGDTAPVIENLNLHMGTDGLGQLLFSTEYEGDPAMDSDGHALLLGGQPLYYHVVGNVLTATTAVGGGGSLGFTVTLNSNGTYTFDVNGTISNGTETNFTNLTSAAAGNVNYRGVGADNASNNTGNTDLLLSASNGASIATVNTNSTAVGSGNQSMNAGESVRIDFVSNMTSGGGATGFNYGAHVNTNSYEQKIPQVQGAQTETVAIHVYALNSNLTASGLPDSSPSGGFADSPTLTAITTVTVTDYATLVESPPVDISGVAVGDWTTVAFGVSVQKQADGSVIFSGLQEGDSYSIGTGLNNFNAVVVEGVATGTGPAGHLSTTDGFDLGILSIGSVTASTPIVQNFNIVAIDGDGDPQAGVISTTIDPVVTTLAAKSMVVASEPVTDTLLATNDNLSSGNDHGAKHGELESRLLQSANTNSFAVAAAVAGGLGFAVPAAAEHGLHEALDASGGAMPGQALPFTAFAADQGDSLNLGVSGESRIMVKAEVTDAVAIRAGNGDEGHSDGLAGAVADHSQQVSQFAAPTEAAHSAPEVSSMVAPMVGMPTAEMIAAANLDGHVQKAGQVDKVLAESLADHGGAKIDQMLQAATGHEGGDAVAKLAANVASPDVGHVQAWDMAMAMGSHPAADMMFKADASMLHHDAIQPTVHG